MTKRVVFTGPDLPIKKIDLARFNRNPVVLWSHDWASDPLGMLVNVKAHIKKNQLSGRPVFHKLTQKSEEVAKMYGKGLLNAYMGGEATYKKNAAGEDEINEHGGRTIEKFILYEVSLAP